MNVLVALAWPNHPHHGAARRWFDKHHRDGWATTPVTETGFVRVSSNRSAVSVPSTPAVATRLLRNLTALPGHEFWPDDVDFVTDYELDVDAVRQHPHVTDAHLLALARRRGGRLVTFDAGVVRLLPPDELELADIQTADDHGS